MAVWLQSNSPDQESNNLFDKRLFHKSTLIKRGLYSYRQRYSLSQWSKCCGLKRRSNCRLFYLSIEGNWKDSFSTSRPCLRSDKGIAWHADASSVVCTLIDNSKLTNQIATLLQIVVIFFLRIRGKEKLAFHQIVSNDQELAIFSILRKASSFHHIAVSQIDGHISFLFL